VSVGVANDLPLNGNELDAVEIEGRNSSTTPAVRQTWVLGDYLRTMGIPLIRGRVFTPEDRQGTQPVTVVSESMAKILWPNEDPIGKRILRGGAIGQWLTVIGVVGDVPDGAMSSSPRPHCYSPYLQERDAAIEGEDGSLRSLDLAVRSSGNPDTVAAGVVDRLHRLDPVLAISNVRTMQTDVSQSIAPQRFNAMLVGIYAGLALILALIGIYGVLAYMVMQQTHEMGIRMALGAQRRHILALVIAGGMRLVLAGAAVGLVGAWAVTRLMQGLLYGVAPGDPITFLAVTALLSGAALLACYIPALRAARIDPMAALRYE
jgi:putative ABC transport system permease protein